MGRLYFRWRGREIHDVVNGINRTACRLHDFMLLWNSEHIENSKDIILPQRARTKKEVTE
ncbi:MAG: hypothetical protein A2W25_16970 [candidate division Zixibacteria bacterium RBG_16_53_22]|nr:MAG: hypothetical protein A2W25_16970 [candidate division Zixibacteria bacterium RBG_16_53_22]